jgi:hypothetical protein
VYYPFGEGARELSQYRYYAMGWLTGAQFLVEDNDGMLSLYHHIQTSYGDHLASHPVGTRAFSSGVKWPGHEVDHSSPYAKFKNLGIFASIHPQMSS